MAVEHVFGIQLKRINGLGMHGLQKCEWMESEDRFIKQEIEMYSLMSGAPVRTALSLNVFCSPVHAGRKAMPL